MKTIRCVAMVLACAVSVGSAEELSLNPTKDARILGHSSEQDQNGGASTRLRTTGIAKTATEFAIFDFDRAAIKDFVEKNKGKTLSGKFTVNIREAQGMTVPAVKLEVASIDAASEWNEGGGAQAPAKKGESCATAAKFDEKKWALPNGAEVGEFRDLVWDGAQVKGLVNSKGVEITKDSTGQQATIEIDAALVKHLGSSASSQGLFLFHRDGGARIDVYSREQANKGAVLVLKAE